MALYIPHSIFHFARLLYVRPETFGPYYVDCCLLGYVYRRFGRTSCLHFRRSKSRNLPKRSHHKTPPFTQEPHKKNDTRTQPEHSAFFGTEHRHFIHRGEEQNASYGHSRKNRTLLRTRNTQNFTQIRSTINSDKWTDRHTCMFCNLSLLQYQKLTFPTIL